MGSLPLSIALSRQYVSFYWTYLLGADSLVNAILVLLLIQNFVLDIAHAIAFLAVTTLVPFLLSLGSTLYLSGIGEKRVIRIWNIQVLSTGVVLITEYARINNLSAFIGLALVLVVYLLGMGFVLDVVSLPVLGIAGGRSDCVWNLMICDVDATKVSQYLADDRIRDALESEPLRTRTGYWILRNSERIGFNWFAFLFAHPELDSRCVILLIGYNRKQFQIEGGRLAVNRLRGTMLSLVDLLNGKVAPDSSYSLDDFLQRYPNFVYRSDTAFHYALRPTEIPFRRLQKLSITAKAIIITILGTFTVSIILLAEGQINEAQAGLSLIPELALVGAEVLPLIPRRRRNR